MNVRPQANAIMRGALLALPHLVRSPCSALLLPMSTVRRAPASHLPHAGLLRSALKYPPNLFRHHASDKVQKVRAREVDQASIHPPSQSLRCELKLLLLPNFLTAAALNRA